MAYLIDESYFIKELYVPNAQELNTGAGDELSLFIDSKARQCLKDALGYVLYNSLNNDIDSSGNLKSDAAQRWKDLVKGVEYTKDDKTYFWSGLIYQEGNFKKSLIANYTFYFWLEEQVSQQSGLGEVRGQAKNAINVDTTRRLVKVWNDFVTMYQEGTFKRTPLVFYQDAVKVTDWFQNSTESGFVSLLQFLQDKKEDYPDAAMKYYNKINYLGL